jgi:hypothetical protein
MFRANMNNMLYICELTNFSIQRACVKIVRNCTTLCVWEQFGEKKKLAAGVVTY